MVRRTRRLHSGRLCSQGSNSIHHVVPFKYHSNATILFSARVLLCWN